MTDDPRIAALPDIHGHAKGEHKPFAEERPIPYTARMLFLWFFHACRRGAPRFVMVADHMNYLTFEDPAAVNLVRRALKLAQAGDLYGAAETAGVELGHAAAVSDGLRKGMRYSIGAEIDNDPRCRPDAQNIVDAMRPDGMIRSIHFLPITHPQHGENWMWAFDNHEFKELYEVIGTERVWEIYMTTLLEAIEKLPGHIIGHFYVPAKFGHWPEEATLEGYEDRLLDACAERGLAIEVNSRYFYKHFAGDDEQLARFRSAHLRLLRKAAQKNVMIAVGSDAHSPKDQGAGFDAVLTLLDEAHINEIAFPINGRLARVALRATDEIRRQHAAALSSAPVAPPAAAGGETAVEEAAASGPARSAPTAARSQDAAPAPPVAAPAPPARARRAKGRAPAPLAGETSLPQRAADSPVAAARTQPDSERPAEAAPAAAVPSTPSKPPARKRPARKIAVPAGAPPPAAGDGARAAAGPQRPARRVAAAPRVAQATPVAPTTPAAAAKQRPSKPPTKKRRAPVAAQAGRTPAAKKAAAHRPGAKKTAVTKASVKRGSKRPATKKPAARKVAGSPAARARKKAPARKAPAARKGATSVKRAPPKRAAPKHVAAKKSTTKKAKPRR